MDIWAASSLSYYEQYCYKYRQTGWGADMFLFPRGKD